MIKTIRLLRKHMGLWYVILIPIITILGLATYIHSFFTETWASALVQDGMPIVFALIICSIIFGITASEILDSCNNIEDNK
jgi:hypothetical protein